MIQPGAPRTTVVRNRAPGPSTLSAATAVRTFALEAGANHDAACWEKSTLPVDRSVTTPPACGPSGPAANSGASAAPTPRGLGAAPGAVAGARTVPGAASGADATRGTRNSASRPGSALATATPAPSVNALSSAS